jgi:putative spermidine/putrescine transport system permease protein
MQKDTPGRGRPTVLGVYIGIFIVFLMAPIVLIIPMSFNSSGSLTFPPSGLSLQWYQELFSSGPFARAFRTSLIVTVISTALSVGIGCLACYGIARYRFPGRAALVALLMSPLVFPHIVLGVAMIIFLNAIGLLRSVAGLVIATVIVTIPYVVRILSPAIQALDSSVDDVAMVLGAGRLRVLWNVVLPNVRTGLFAASVLCGLVAFDEFTVALFITGGDTVTVPVQIYLSSYYGVSPVVAAVGTLLIILSALVVIALERAVGIERVLGLPQLALREEDPS